MKKVDQIFTTKGRGDCQRAVIASLFELELIQVPHFLLFDENVWLNVYCMFIKGMGYEFEGTGYLDTDTLKFQETIGGGISASVPSKNLGKGYSHAVIVNTEGLVIHDPHPSKNYQGVNVIETGELQNWDMISKAGD